MPVSTRESEADLYGDKDHWKHVMESLFVKAVEAAGFEPIRPVAQGSHLIHGMIIRHLSEADLVLCDLSAHNPNVFFELGVRTSLNLPIALVRDEQTDLPFDTSGINTHTYDSKLRGWEIENEQKKLIKHIEDSAKSCNGQNPLWRQFGLMIRAQEPETAESPLEAKVDLLTDRMLMLQHQMFEEAQRREVERLESMDLTPQDMALRRRRLSEARHEAAHSMVSAHDAASDAMLLFIERAEEFVQRRNLPVTFHIVDESNVRAQIHDAARFGQGHGQQIQEIADRHRVAIAFEVDADSHNATGSQVHRGRLSERRHNPS